MRYSRVAMFKGHRTFSRHALRPHLRCALALAVFAACSKSNDANKGVKAEKVEKRRNNDDHDEQAKPRGRENRDGADANTNTKTAKNLPGLGVQDDSLARELHAVHEAKKGSYQAHYQHRQADGSPRFTNRLIRESSPFLLQHAHEPVNWHPWGDEAFRKAREEGKPVFVSIGFSTSQWCHDMARESFNDLEIASELNLSFVPVLVDRELRPDIDAIYTTAAALLSPEGGWPLNLMLTPDQQVFFAGHYLRPRDGEKRDGPGFLTVIRDLKHEYDTNRTELVARAQQLGEEVIRTSKHSQTGERPGIEPVDQALRGAKNSYNPTWGGFGRAPKYPRPSILELMLRYHRRSGDPKMRVMVFHTLERIASGGIHDQIGGGFHRLATDAQWLLPHFEKTLADNAQLVPTFLDAFALTQDTIYADPVRDTLAFIDRELSRNDGLFFAALDAQSANDAGEFIEGYYYTWTIQEVIEALGSLDAKPSITYFNLKKKGNFASRNVLSTPIALASTAAKLAMPVDDVRANITQAKQLLLQARNRRKAPPRDETISTFANGLAISAFARAGFMLGDEEAVIRAQRAATALLKEMRTSDGSLGHSQQGGQVTREAFLDDYAFLIQGLLDLYEASFEPSWLDHAIALQAILDARFGDRDQGGYFMTSRESEALWAQDQPVYDGSIASANSIALANLLRLADLTGDLSFLQSADRTQAGFSRALHASARSYPRMLATVEHRLDEALRIYLAIPASLSDTQHRRALLQEPMLAALRSAYLPNRAIHVVFGDEGLDALRKRHAGLKSDLQGLRPTEDKISAVVCQGTQCEAAITDAKALTTRLSRAKPWPQATKAEEK